MFKPKDALALRRRSLTLQILEGGSQLGTILSAKTGFVSLERAYDAAIAQENYTDAEKHLNAMESVIHQTKDIIGNHEPGSLSL